MNGFKSTKFAMLYGASATLMRSRRRGSFLVLVVGTLAMLSIIMIVYVAVGSSDKRASRSLERRTRSDEIITLFSDYVAQIVADDSVAVAPDPSNGKGGNTQTLYMREAWDAPVTDWTMDSTISPATTVAADQAKVFRVVGTGDDPWLASTTPTWINFDPANPANNPPPIDGTKKNFMKRRDWLHISNVAPDGRFVNLFNLRDNFDAKPGTSEAAGDLHMNGNLSLTDQAGTIDAPTAWNVLLGTPTAPNSNYQNPAIFDSWQVGAFRPARGPFYNGATPITPSQAAYPPYQWADADGDGFFDSRWFEMIDARDANQTGGPAAPQFFRKLLPTDPNYRWFFATRIIDLSSLVNVNTAGDGNADPNNSAWTTNPAAQPGIKGSVMGLSPSDIDLRRLLTMRDATESVLNGSATGTITIDGVPYNGGYSGLLVPPNSSPGSPSSQDYSGYDDVIVAPRTLGIAQDLGFGAYEALRATLNVGRPPGRFSDYTQVPLKDAKNSFKTFAERNNFYKRSAPAVARPAYRATDASLGDPAQLHVSGGGGNPGAVSGAIDYGLGFRMSNLLELLTYRSVNDPSVSSTLESALGGKLQSAFSTAPTTADFAKKGESFGPLRENRSLELERENLAYAAPNANAGRPTEAAMLRSYTDLRQYLTTLSGARPIIASSVSVANVDQPPALTSTDLSTYVPEDPTAAELFPAYATALMPGLPLYKPTGTVVNIWDVKNDTEAKRLRGMFYGGQGPITALLAAGHMAANFASGAQPQDGTASRAPYVLVLAEPTYKDAAGSLPADTVAFTDWKEHFPSWWSDAGRRLNLARLDQTNKDGAKLSVDKAAPIPAPAVNIYGMGDPHPFLTDVASITVYRDVPIGTPISNSNTVDSENMLIGQPPEPQFITVNGYLGDENKDFMFRAVAVKLHNPFPTPITLSRNVPTGSYKIDGTGSQFAPNSLDDFFYIQIGSGAESTFFVLAEVDETKVAGTYGEDFTVKPVVILPGETIVFYALSREKKFIVFERFNGTDKNLTGDQFNPTEFDLWLDTQFGTKAGALRRRVQMVRVDNEKFRTGVAANTTFAVSQLNATQLVPPYTGASPPDSTVLLRRAVRIDSGSVNDSAAGTPNSIANDQVCDRLRLGTAFTLDRRLVGVKPPTGIQGYNPTLGIAGMYARPSISGFEAPGDFTYNSKTWVNTNTRFTIALVEHAGRKNENLGANYKPGMLPAWAIDPKDEPAADWYMKTQIPAPQAQSSIKLTAAIVSAETNRKSSGENPAEWRKIGPYIESMPLRAEQRTEKLGPNIPGTTFEDLRRELAANGNKYQGYNADYTPNDVSQIRPTDLLNVMAIGATHVPLDIDGNRLEISANVPDLMKQWTTTAEALAIAMGYANRDQYDASKGNTQFGPLDYFYFDQTTVDATSAKPLFDSGYLKLDDFVPVTYDTSGNPYTAGSGAPIAGNILSMFRVHPDAFASMSIATPGIVNINTAPQAVLRVLPFTFPSTNELIDKSDASRVKSTFWFGAAENERASAALRTDIAAMIESYRDKIAVELRPKAKGTVSGGESTMPTWFAGFFDRSKLAFAAAGDQDVGPNDAAIGDFSTITTNPAVYKGGRYWSTGVTGIREGAGFRSVGELLAVKQVEFDPTTKAVSTPASDLEKRTSNIDFLGHSTVPTNMFGMDNILEKVLNTADPPAVTDIKPLQFGKTYQDKLKILSGLLGSITVRSDMYAVWFIARGYQRSDVEGLPALQPMVPSVERRFLMIIDRSNVTKVGQKPRVLAFVELPL